MPKRDASFFVIDILIAIDKVERYMGNITSIEQLERSEQTVSSVLMELHVIGEAMKAILGEGSLKDLTQKEWRYATS